MRVGVGLPRVLPDAGVAATVAAVASGLGRRVGVAGGAGGAGRFSSYSTPGARSYGEALDGVATGIGVTSGVAGARAGDGGGGAGREAVGPGVGPAIRATLVFVDRQVASAAAAAAAAHRSGSRFTAGSVS